MSAEKRKYIIYTILDFMFTYGGSAAVILYTYLVPETELGYKLSLTGIILFLVVLFSAKASFEKHYQEKLDGMLQQLAETTDPSVKNVITAEINSHKIKNSIYQRIMLLLPFVVLVFVTTVAIKWLENLRDAAGLILTSMGAGSVFNVLKKPQKEKLTMQKFIKKAK